MYINMICYERYNSNWSQALTGFTNSLLIDQYDIGKISQVIHVFHSVKHVEIALEIGLQNWEHCFIAVCLKQIEWMGSSVNCLWFWCEEQWIAKKVAALWNFMPIRWEIFLTGVTLKGQSIC
jgi:hypothetical protein